MSQKRHHERLDGQCLITMKGKMGIRRERKQNPRNRNGYIKTSHPKWMQSSSIIFGITPSGIGVVKSPKDTAEENGGHIYQQTAQTIRKSNKRQKMQTSDGNKRKADTLKINGAHQAIMEASEFAHEGMQFQTQDSGFKSK